MEKMVTLFKSGIIAAICGFMSGVLYSIVVQMWITNLNLLGYVNFVILWVIGLVGAATQFYDLWKRGFLVACTFSAGYVIIGYPMGDVQGVLVILIVLITKVAVFVRTK